MISLATIAAVRGALRSRWTMAQLCDAMPTVPRDVMVEVIDACRRFPSDHDAQKRVNEVLALQAMEVPLINGHVAYPKPALAIR